MLVYLCAPPKLALNDAHVSCICCCVDAPLVCAGLVCRVDSAGKPACESCGMRLSRCKGKPHRQDPGHICHRCYTQASRTPSSASPTFTPLVPKRSHKRRRADSDPGKQAYNQATPAEATEQPEDTNWDPTPAKLAAWKPDPQLAAAIAAQEAEWALALLLNGLVLLLVARDATSLAQARRDGMRRDSTILIRIVTLVKLGLCLLALYCSRSVSRTTPRVAAIGRS